MVILIAFNFLTNNAEVELQVRLPEHLSRDSVEVEVWTCWIKRYPHPQLY